MIASVIQRGQVIYVYDERGMPIWSKPIGPGLLQGYTPATTVTVRLGNMITVYDERGMWQSSIPV